MMFMYKVMCTYESYFVAIDSDLLPSIRINFSYTVGITIGHAQNNTINYTNHMLNYEYYS